MKPAELFTAIANAIRAKDSTSDPIPAITFPERIMGLSGGGGGENGWAIAPPVKVRATAEAISGKYYTHMLFNGVRLPRIPFAYGGTPYAFIKQNNSGGYYEMYLSTGLFYRSASTIRRSATTQTQRYRLSIANAETATEWESLTATSSSSVAFDSANPILWSSHDIPDGSATEVSIYFEGTDPVPVD